MKPGPAMSIDSTQRSTAGLARSAAISSAATSRGLRFSALASGIAAVRRGRRARPASATRTAAASVLPGLTSSIAARSASSNSSRAWIIGEFYEAAFAASPRGAKSARAVNKASVDAARRHSAPRVGARMAVLSDAARMSIRRLRLRSAAPPAPAAKPCRRRSASTAILGRLGDGATSEVFLGYDDFQRPQRRDQARARRRPPADPIDGHYSERFFAAEAALVGRLQHPNVVQIFDAVADPVEPYLVMEYVPAARCGRTAAPTSCCSLELIVEIGFKCAMALGYVYRQGLIHRDVKPANLLAVLTNGDDHRRQDQRLRQRAQPRLRRDPDLPRRLARLHVARAARRRHARLPRRHLLARRRAVPPDRRPAARSMRRCSRP